jgi:hypothetical protein
VRLVAEFAGMVNARFRKPHHYGFEIVHTRLPRISCTNRHQSKIYGESSSRHFSQIFAGLISMQTLAIYPRPLVLKMGAVGA